MRSETDKRPFGNKVLRLFALVGLTVSGVWLFKNLGVMALFGLPEANVVYWVAVAFPLLPFFFFLWAFRKTGTSKRNLARPVLIALLVLFILAAVAINVVELLREDSSLEEARPAVADAREVR